MLNSSLANRFSFVTAVQALSFVFVIKSKVCPDRGSFWIVHKTLIHGPETCFCIMISALLTYHRFLFDIEVETGLLCGVLSKSYQIRSEKLISWWRMFICGHNASNNCFRKTQQLGQGLDAVLTCLLRARGGRDTVTTFHLLNPKNGHFRRKILRTSNVLIKKTQLKGITHAVAAPRSRDLLPYFFGSVSL